MSDFGEMPVYNVNEDGILISTERSRIDLAMVHEFLSTSYWGEGITLPQVERQVGASLPFGLYIDGRMIGFCRVISDYTRWAMLCDVIVLEEHQGRGYGRRLVRATMDHPELRDVNRWILATKDVHGVYEPCGFTELGKPEMWMERKLPKEGRRWR